MAKSATSTTSYEDMSLDELKALLDEVSHHYEIKKEARRKELLAELAELGGLPAPAAPATPRQGSGGQGKPAPVKYRNPETGETYSGRGQMAAWLKAKVDAGEDKDKYLVQPEMV